MLMSDSGAGGKFLEQLGEVGVTKENSYFFVLLSYCWAVFFASASCVLWWCFSLTQSYSLGFLPSWAVILLVILFLTA